LVLFKGITWVYSGNYIYEVGIVLDFCEGGTIKGRLDEIRGRGDFSENGGLKYLNLLQKWSLQVVDAMKFLESKNVSLFGLTFIRLFIT
jgi:hypothetical protein